METILSWTAPFTDETRFYLVQGVFWSGYFFLVGLIGTFPLRFTKFRQTAWTTLVMGSMGTLISYLSQFLFKLEEPLDMLSPYALGVAIVVTLVLAPLVSLFTFVCQTNYDDYDARYPDDYDEREPDDYDEEDDGRSRIVSAGYPPRHIKRRPRPRR